MCLELMEAILPLFACLTLIPSSRLLYPAKDQFLLNLFPFLYFFLANMNLTILAGFLLAVTMATARGASLVRIRDLFFLISAQYLIDFDQFAQNTQGERTMRAAGKADEPDEAMREAAEPASLVNTMLNSF